ncbi:GRP family sugar transporter [Schaalia vaccimaxillae]|uniref:GRP family sugar transporter n=1 Tax=Schaalia vaccimaxillae TaxID=183916 RepID=UPI0003B5F07D|nr:GRP family sugar transporter [Schaalia vaccimaxillae]
MDVLLALTPSILFGFQTTLTGKFGAGNERQKVLGTVIGAFMLALVVTPFLSVCWDPTKAAIAFGTGLLVGWGLCDQLRCFSVLGVSRTMPITTGGQLLGMAAGAIILFGEWRRGAAMPVGLLAIAVLVAGIALLAKREAGSSTDSLDWRRGAFLLITSTFAFTAYVLIGRWFDLEGGQILLPQAAGYALYCISYFAVQAWREPNSVQSFDRRFVPLILLGAVWGTAVILLQVGSASVGVATGFTLSQLGILISTPLGIWWLGEKRTQRELVWTAIGVVLVIAGAVLTGVAKGIDTV